MCNGYSLEGEVGSLEMSVKKKTSEFQSYSSQKEQQQQQLGRSLFPKRERISAAAAAFGGTGL